MKLAFRVFEVALNITVMAVLIILLTLVLGVGPLSGTGDQGNIQIAICLVSGGLLMTAMFSSTLRLFSRRERAGQYFAMFCVGQTIRFFFMDASIGPLLFPGLSETAILALKYIPFTLGVTGLVMFVYEIYGEGRSLKIKRAVIASIMVVNLLIAALGLDRTIWRAILGAPVALCFIANSIYVILRSPEFKADRLSILYLFGFVLYAISFSFTASMYASVPYIAVVFNFAFAAIHAVLLASRYAKALKAVEQANALLEEKVQERTRELTKANAQLTASERSVRELVQNISHDLKTPLSVMSVNLEMLLEDETPPKTQRRLSTAYQKNQDMARLIQNLFDAVRPGPSAPEKPMDWVGLSALMSEVDVRYHGQLENAGISLTVSYRQDCLVQLSEEIWRVFDNLIANAQRYTPKGGAIKLIARGSEGSDVIISVSDTGPGVPQEHLPHLFDRYYKTAPSRGGSGAGLGLYIVKNAIEAMGGTVSANSKPGQGLNISFALKARPIER